jgi:hypothetical protein
VRVKSTAEIHGRGHFYTRRASHFNSSHTYTEHSTIQLARQGGTAKVAAEPFVGAGGARAGGAGDGMGGGGQQGGQKVQHTGGRGSAWNVASG